MNTRTFLKSLAVLAGVGAIRSDALASVGRSTSASGDWALNMDVLESCSCPVFCQCFFTGKPPASMSMDHEQMGAEHVCRFNQAYRVNRGHLRGIALDGLRFWFAGDAGDDFDKPKLEWAVFTFDPAASQKQREALLSVLRHLRWYRPGRWKSYAIGSDAPIHWAADEKGARATLGGTLAELKLTTMAGMQDRPVTVSNLDYFGYPRNSGFVLMPSDLLAYRQGPHPFEYVKKGTNGFHTRVEMNAADFPQTPLA